MRTTNQISGSLGFGVAMAVIIVWVLGRTIGLSADESNLLAPAITTIITGVTVFLSPYLPQPRQNAVE